MKLTRIICFTVVASAAALASSFSYAASSYRITDLGSGMVSAINDLGQIVGTFTTSVQQETSGGSFEVIDESRAFLYRNGSFTNLGVLGRGDSGYSSGLAINNAGQIVGLTSVQSTSYSGGGHGVLTPLPAYLYSNGQMQNLNLTPQTSVTPHAINAQGHIVGQLGVLDYQYNDSRRAFVYVNGSSTDIGTIGGWAATAAGINDFDQITGTTMVNGQDGIYHAFLYANSAMADLGTLGGLGSSGSAINNAGQVTGYSDTSDQSSHAFLYSNGQMLDLGTLGGGGLSTGNAINDLGQVVGQVISGGTQTAFVYDAGSMKDLNALLAAGSPAGWQLLNAVDINNAGVIIGLAMVDGQVRSFMAAPVQEPISLGLVVAGLGVVALKKKRDALGRHAS